MNSYNFLRKDGHWQLNFSNYQFKPGNNTDVALIDGAASILNFLAEGNNEVNLVFDKKPFQDAEEIELLQTCEPFLKGGYYLLKNYQGKEINYQMWLSDITTYVFEETPQKFYFKKRPW